MLKPETESLWAYLREQPQLSNFVLIGGSALALQINHRISEDLDFCTSASTLPGKALDELITTAEAESFHFEATPDLAALEEFERSGMNLEDYQRDYVVNDRVKVTFFTLDSAHSKVIGTHSPGEDSDHVRLATLPELFRSKAIVASQRAKTRDWFDLYCLLTEHGFTLRDFRDAYRIAGIGQMWEVGLTRITSGNPSANDEGYRHLAADSPDLEQIVGFFRAERDQLERELASEKKAD